MAVLMLIVGMSAAQLRSATATAVSSVLPYGAGGYHYQQVPTGAGPADFSDVAFDDTAFSVGAAPFGVEVPALNCALTPSTPWAPNTDLLVRRVVPLAAGATDVVIHLAIDNDIELFWNGTPIGSFTHDNCATQDSIEVAVPSNLLVGGDNLLAARASDRGGESYVDFALTANLPPDCASVVPDETSLWPPSHDLRLVTVHGGTDPEGDPLTLAIAAVTQDEPVDGSGDGRTAPDADRTGLPKDQVRLRAERAGDGDGRVYRISVVGSDPSGASCSTIVFVGVPHDQRGASPIDNVAVVVDSFSLAASASVSSPNPPTTVAAPAAAAAISNAATVSETASPHAEHNAEVPAAAPVSAAPTTSTSTSTSTSVAPATTTPEVTSTPTTEPSPTPGKDKQQGSGATNRHEPDANSSPRAANASP
ncbi:MAG TPA: hypothetical protein VGQ20_08410 [Acidimicrobiales bacterium]|nr:hypothetical protein [Acidimicrobiales bacterium]